MSFSDHFSSQAEKYARFRPEYPLELYDYLFGQIKGKGCAWDCATGNGQAARQLAKVFTRVEATDASQRQISQAKASPNIRYQLSAAEKTPFEANTFDLVTVAQALHWFEVEAFYQEVRRVGKPGAIIAIWTYGPFEIGDETDGPSHRFYREVVGPYWPPERQHVDEAYARLPFPFDLIKSPNLSIQLPWNLEQLLGYFSTWSATQRFVKERQQNPIDLIREEMGLAWGDPQQTRVVKWPITMKVGSF